MYYFRLVNWYLTRNNFLRITEQDAPAILHASISDEPLALVNDDTCDTTPLLEALIQNRWHGRLVQDKSGKILEIWRPGLIIFKRPDWSIVHHGGTTLQQDFYYQVDAAVGGKIQKGSKVAVKVLYGNREYDAYIRNVNRTQVPYDAYQLMYKENPALIEAIVNYFADIVPLIKPHHPAEGPHYFEVMATEEGRVFRLNLFSGDDPGDIEFGQYIRAFNILRNNL